MKRLAGLLLIAALFILPVTMASAQNYAGNNIRGSFTFSGHSTCLLAYGGFSTSLVPNGPSDTLSGPWEGTLTFNPNGKGHLDATERTILIPGTVPFTIGTPSSNSQHNVWDFDYTVDDGVITFTYIQPKRCR